MKNIIKAAAIAIIVSLSVACTPAASGIGSPSNVPGAPGSPGAEGGPVGPGQDAPIGGPGAPGAGGPGGGH